jgi:hypothetical protein
MSGRQSARSAQDPVGGVTVEMQSSQPISDDDLAELLALLDRGRQAWIEGDLGYGPGLDVRQVRLHRHADPLIDRRTPPETFAIAGGQRRS